MAKVVLLIGVSEYEPGLNPLPSEVRDVEGKRRRFIASLRSRSVIKKLYPNRIAIAPVGL
ncbi:MULTISPECIES: hypothetical protein [Nostoc]|uniref:Uncharacterized protein n=2 Tax=Nostoc TaxID=1177 RepID=A0ABR8IKI7_9NOSO|nr:MULTISPECIES: hypothetical protein [Nostoc]MBD2565303.1 hypothetical protein [Nostoc linckia FACHB-391]MBD2651015.1 hypothetical protein [Nostoc foliaceum FACHB-393]